MDITEDVDLTLDKEFQDVSVDAGTNNHTFTIVVTNNGQSDADAVNVLDVVDARLEVTNVAPAGDCGASAGQTVDCTFDLAANGGTNTITVTYKVDASVEADTVSNTADAEDDDGNQAGDTDSVDITEDVDLTLDKEFQDVSVDAGTNNHTFTIVVTNNGQSDADAVNVLDVVDARLEVTNVAPAGDCGASAGQTVDCTFDLAANGGTNTITVTYKVDASVEADTVSNTADAEDDDGNQAGDTDSVDITEDVDLTLDKEFQDVSVDAGTNNHTFTIVVTNNGQSDADAVNVLDVVDARLEVTNVAPAGDCGASAGQTVDCTFDLAANGGTNTITVTYKVDASVEADTVSNTADAEDDDGNQAGDTDSVDITEDVDLTLDKEFQDVSVDAGTNNHTFTIVVTNNGQSDADAVNVLDVVDARLEVTNVAPAGDCGASAGQTVDCTFDLAANGGTNTITVTYKVDASVEADTVSNTADAEDDDGNQAGDTDSVDITEDVDLTLDKEFQDVSVDAGTNNHTFTIVVTNNGQSDADAVNVLDVVDARLEVTNVAPAGDCGASAGQTVDCTFDLAANGGTNTITVTYKVDASVEADTVSNTADAEDDDGNQAGDTDSVDITEDVDLTLDKEFQDVSVDAGTNNHTFTIVVTNNGQSDADAVNVLDVVDARLEVTNVAPAGDCGASAGQTVDCTFDLAANGGTNTITVTYKVDASVEADTVSNTADAEDDDGNQAGDTDSVDITEDVDLTLDKEFQDVSVDAGTNNHTFTIVVTNNGQSDADAVNVLDVVDARLEVTNVAPAGDCGASAGQTVDCTFDLAANGGTNTITVTYKVDASVEADTVSNTADAEDDDGNQAGDTDSVDITEDVDLTLDKEFQDVSVDAGTNNHTFTIVVTNNGQSDADAVNVLDVVDARLEVTNVAPAGDCGASAGQTVDCTFDLAANGGTNTITVTYKVDASVEADTVSNTADAEDDDGNQAGDTDSVDITEDVDLTLDKEFQDVSVDAGTNNHTFTIVVTNNGQSDADAVNVLDVVDARLEVTNVAPAGDCGASAGQTVDCTFDLAANGGTNTITVTYKVDASVEADTVSNTADAEDDDGNQAGDTDSVDITEDVDLTLDKEFQDVSVDAGTNNHTFTIVVTNNGQSDADAVNVLDVVDARLEVTNVAPAGDCGASAGQTVDCTFDLAANGGTNTITVTYKVDASVEADTVSNTADAEDDDGNQAGDTDSVDITEDVDLTLDKEFQDVSVDAGTNNHTFTIVVTNNGQSDADAVNVLDVVDARLEVTNVAPAGDCGASAGQTVDCTFDLAANGGTNTITVTYKVDASVEADTVSNTADAEDDDGNQAGDTDSVDITEDVDLTLDKEFQDVSVDAGTNNHTFTIVVTNNGQSDADAVNVLDVVDARLEVTNVAPAGDCGASAGQTVDCTFDLAANGGTNTITVTYKVDASVEADTVSNTADAEDDDGNQAGDTDSVDITEDVDLTLDKEFQDVSVDAGTNNHTFTIVVTNNGQSDADAVNVLDVVDARLEVTNVAPAGDCGASAGQTVDCTFDLAANGGTNTITVTYKVDASVEADTVSNTADAEDDDGNQAGDTDSVDITEDVDLTLDKEFQDVSVDAGTNNHTFTIVVTNNGQSDADAVNVLDVVDARLEVTNVAPAGDCGASAGQTVDCTFDLAANGGTNTITVTYKVDASVEADTVSNTADAEDDDGNQAGDTDSVDITEDVDLTLDKEFQDVSVDAGTNNHTFTIVVTNNGQSDADAVNVLDVVDARLEVTNVAPAGDCGASAGQTVDCTFDLAANGGTNTITVTYKVDASVEADTVSNTADAEDDDGNQAGDTDSVDITTKVDLVVTKTDSPDPVVVLNNLTYTITVQNLGPSDAQNVVVTDTLPAELLGEKFCTGAGCDPSVGSPWTGSTTFTTIAATQTKTVIIRAQVGSYPSGGTLSNTASVTSNTPRINMGNDLDTETTAVNKRTTQLVYTGASNGQYSDPVGASATLRDTTNGSPGTPIAGATVTFTLSGQTFTATTNALGVAATGTTIPDRLNQPAGSKTMASAYAGDGVYANASDSDPYTVNLEGATVSSIAPSFIAVDGADNDKDSLELTLTIDETNDTYLSSALPNAPSGQTGLKNAYPIPTTLTRVSNNTTFGSCTPALSTYTTVDSDTSTAKCSIANVPSDTYQVDADIQGDYFDGSGVGALVVYNPALGFITGGGRYTTNEGVLNFGFNAKLKSGTSAQGSLLVILHRPEGNYILKSNAMGTLTTTKDVAGNFWTALLKGKATFQVPNSQPALECGERKCGNYSWTMYVEDRKEPGSGYDKFWLEVKDSNGVVVAKMSLPNPPAANAKIIDQGNIQVPQPQSSGK